MKMKGRVASAAIGLCVSLAAEAFAQEYSVPLKRHENISGVDVMFEGKADYSIPLDQCAPIPLKLIIYLDDLNSKLPAIVRTTGVEKNESCGDKVEIHGAHIWNENGLLIAKVEGKVGRQECIKTKVPEFKGIKITMKTRIIASNTFETNASVSAAFKPSVEHKDQSDAGSLRFSQQGSADLRVSNDIYRNLLDLFNLDNKLEGKVTEAVQKALNDPKAALELPENLTSINFRFESAAIESINSRLALSVSGQSPRSASPLADLFGYLAGKTGQAVPVMSCP
jgi:hypothetical protein